jgi:Cu/Zn superoxide dismutase
MNKAHLLAGTVLLVVACGGSAQPGATAPTSAPAPLPPALVFPMAGAGAVNQGVTGTVTIQKTADGSGFRITIDVKGLVPDSLHVYHIHKGSCANNGPIVTPLPNPLRADAAGHATAVNDVGSPYQGTGFYANVHTGPDLSSAANAAPCACGDLADKAA